MYVYMHVYTLSYIIYDIALSSKTKGATVGRAARLALRRLSLTAEWRKARRARVAVAIGCALDPSSPAAGGPSPSVLTLA